MKLTLGFSPCPNDTFIFDAMVNKKIDTGGLDFEVQLADVQTLNENAMHGRTDITKISYGVLPLVLEEYHVLNSGGALGKGVGPLLIAKTGIPASDINEKVIAIPGKNTTAHMLFSKAFPQAHEKRFLMFSEIEKAVLDGTVDAGVIIHENRFTYQQKGLVKLMDLGEYWESVTMSPIPLGGIVMRRSFSRQLQMQVDELIRKSVEYSFNHYPTITDYVKQHSQEMEEIVMRQHIDLYVNNYSIDLGEEGKAAVEKLLEVYGYRATDIFI
ncbi:MAG: 1,4-dihydroxy-6-naphthoate synthase [Chitinophagaceae bacterium]